MTADPLKNDRREKLIHKLTEKVHFDPDGAVNLDEIADFILEDRRRMVDALKQISLLHHDYCNYWNFKSLTNCKCPSKIARETLKNAGYNL